MVRQKITQKTKRGFTIVELMVALTVFTFVMVIISGAVISIFNANQKSKTLRSVMDNLNFTMESMNRTIRFGKDYHCGPAIPSFPITVPLDCGGVGSNTMTVLGSNGITTTYALSSGRITKTASGVTTYFTSPDVNITILTFRVYGSTPYSGATDLFQPQVIIVIAGNVGVKASTNTAFTLETTVSQKLFDFQ